MTRSKSHAPLMSECETQAHVQDPRDAGTEDRPPIAALFLQLGAHLIRLQVRERVIRRRHCAPSIKTIEVWGWGRSSGWVRDRA